ncbi:flavodoxin family protein [Planctomycetota bacterium]
MSKKVVAIIGTYRKNHITDSAVSVLLDTASQIGAETEKIYLLDKHIEFCTNCRKCVQEKNFALRGKCVHNDDMDQILSKIDAADAIVLASPVNFSTVTAIMKRFIERLIPYGYWPWGSIMPKMRRDKQKPKKKAVIITSSACPGWLARIIMRNPLTIMKFAAKTIGAKVVKNIYYGTIAKTKDQKLTKKAIRKAQKAAEKLLTN